MNLKARIFPVSAAILCTTMAAPAEICSAAVKPTVDLNRAVVRSVASYYCQSYLSTSGSTAYCSSYARGANNTTRIVISQTLQKQSTNGNWYYYTSWSGNIYSSQGWLDNTRYSLPHGTYRLKTYCTFYTANGGYETNYAYSSNCYI